MIEIILRDKIAVHNVDKSILDMIIAYLKIPNPVYESALEQGYQTRGVPQFIYNFEMLNETSIAVPRGFRKTLYSLLTSMNKKYTIIDKRNRVDLTEMIDSSIIKFRPYQLDAIMDMVKYDEGLLVSGAGSGKTVMGLSLIPILNQKTLWLTHTKPLARQAVDRLRSFLPSLKDEDIGMIGDGKWSIGDVVTVGMIQTLARKESYDLLPYMNEFGMIITDEAHHVPASTFTKVINSFNSYYLYGLTATPYRRDKLENILFQTIGPIAVTVPKEAVQADGGILVASVKYREVPFPVKEEYNFKAILRELMYSIERNNMIVSDVIKEVKKGELCIVLSELKEHCDILHKMLIANGISAGVVTGSYSKKHNHTEIKKLQDGELNVLIATSALLAEGFDYPPLSRGFLGLPFRSASKTEQILGRVSRTFPGKKDALLYDYVDVKNGIVSSQFSTRSAKESRAKTYKRLGVKVI